MVVTLRWSEFDGGFRIEVGPTDLGRCVRRLLAEQP